MKSKITVQLADNDKTVAALGLSFASIHCDVAQLEAFKVNGE